MTGNLFYSESDFLFDEEIGLDYLLTDINQTIILYRVNRDKTIVDDLYGETKKNSVVYHTPVDLKVRYKIEAPKNMSYDKKQNVGRINLIGNLTVFIYDKTLDELDVDVKYGDYIGVKITTDHMEYFVVTNDGRVNYDNVHSSYGFKPLYRTIECVPADPNEFSG